MKKSLYICALMLGGSMFVAAQQTTPPVTTPPTFPSESSERQAPTPDRPSTSIPGSDNPASQTGSQSPAGAERSADPAQSSSGQLTTVTGCISENTGTAAGYVLTDNSGNKYELKGSADLASHVGHEVQIRGQLDQSGSGAASDTGSQPGQSGSTASDSRSDQSTASSTHAGHPAAAVSAIPLNVQSVKMVASTCAQSPTMK